MNHERLNRLLEIYPRTFAEEIGIDLSKGTPAPLFQWAVTATLFANPVQHQIAVDAAKALLDAGLTTSEHMAEASWQERRDVLARGRYGQYDEMMSTQLGDAATWLEETYSGDLRKLREKADRDPAKERELLKEMKGVGDTAADIFFRDVQAIWEENHPLVGELPMKAARRLDITSSEDALGDGFSPEKLPRILSALVMAELKGLEPSELS